MKISFIVPTYKKNDFIKDTLQSILKLEGNFSKEILIIQNGIDKEYEAYLTSLLHEEIYLFSIPAQGVSYARNYGIKISSGDYIVFVDDDDLLSKNFISEAFKGDYSIKKNKLFINNLMSFDMVFSEQNLREDYISLTYKKIGDYQGKDFFKIKGLLSSCCFKIFSRDIILQHSFNTSMTVSEDALFMFEIIPNIKEFQLSNSAFYYRRVRKNSVSQTKKRVLKNVANFLIFSYFLSKIYFLNIDKYSFKFYVNRILASFKFMIINIIK